jgi:phosphopantetheine adenylyltransferase
MLVIRTEKFVNSIGVSGISTAVDSIVNNIMIKTIYAGSFKPPHKGHFHIVKKMLKKSDLVYIFISKKERTPCSKLDGRISKEVWKEYISLLPLKDQSRVRLILSKLVSPTQTAYGFVKSISKKGDLFYLVKSAKNANNKRFSSFKTLKGVKFQELVLPGFENLHSTDMRIALKEGRKSDFYRFLPKMNNMQKNRLWKKLSVLCS